MIRVNKNLMVGLLCAVVCVMAIAYAAFSTNLNITATAGVDSSWNVKITAVSCSTTPVAGGQTGQTATGTKTDTTATFTMGLVQPGDVATCVITVSNNGNIVAKLDTITSTISGTAPITFAVTPTQASLASRANLAASGSETITVTGTYDTSVTAQPAVTKKTISIALTYNQVA